MKNHVDALLPSLNSFEVFKSVLLLITEERNLLADFFLSIIPVPFAIKLQFSCDLIVKFPSLSYSYIKALTRKLLL